MTRHIKHLWKKTNYEKRLNDKKTMTEQQQEAHKLKERKRVKNYRMTKKLASEELSSHSTSSSPYQSKQACGRALKRLARSLPQSPRKKRFVLAKMAKEAGLTVRGQPCQTRKGLNEETVKTVKDYYAKDEISWQAPGRKDRIIIRELLSTGEKIKKTEQVRYLLMSLKEIYNLFQTENENVSIGFSKFCDLRPQNVKLFDQIPHNVCVCMYHENVRLMLIELEKHTNLASNFNEFVQQVTCDDSSKECIYRRCEDCRD